MLRWISIGPSELLELSSKIRDSNSRLEIVTLRLLETGNVGSWEWEKAGVQWIWKFPLPEMEIQSTRGVACALFVLNISVNRTSNCQRAWEGICRCWSTKYSLIPVLQNLQIRLNLYSYNSSVVDLNLVKPFEALITGALSGPPEPYFILLWDCFPRTKSG